MARKRTFEGFLKSYCAELSGLETTSLRRLVAAAASDAPRVAEPLFCLALEKRKLEYLLGLSEGTWMEAEWRGLARRADRYKSAWSWLENCDDAPERYRKVLKAFESQDDLLKADRRMVAIMRSRTLDALGRSGETRYALARDLGVNKGNLYAWLAGDDAKVSRETATRIMERAEAAAAAA